MGKIKAKTKIPRSARAKETNGRTFLKTAIGDFWLPAMAGSQISPMTTGYMA